MENTNLQTRNNNLGLKGLKIQRIFTKDKKNPYEGIEFEKRTSKLTESNGKIIFEMDDIEVPKDWSQIATDILAQKYLRKKGVPQKNEKGEILKDDSENIILGSEKSAKEAINRLAKTWRWWGEKYGYFDTTEDAQAFEDEIAYMLVKQIASPNSPQWFNTGLALMYGIKGKAQGHWYVDPTTKELKISEDAYTRTQAHACFILSIKDDLVNEGGIFDTLLTEARIFKYGSGSGINFSPIRAKDEELSGGGVSSGLMSFLKIFDAGAGSIKSGGTTRRAAKMVCLDIDHPEIEDFIEWKMKEEKKVVALIAGSHLAYNTLLEIIKYLNENKNKIDENDPKLVNLIKKAKRQFIPLSYIKRILMLIEEGLTPEKFTFETFDSDFRSEAYLTVSGQNSNNSIRVSNDFFHKLENDHEIELKNRVDGSTRRKIKAKTLWEKIIQSAWESADPGLQYDSTINEWHTCPNDGKINASNPCSEYMFLDDTACNLASLNLLKFYDATSNEFKVNEFRHAVRLWTIVLEITVLMSHLPTKKIAYNTYLYRTLGLGYGNLGALLMQMGIPYESEQGYAMTAAITALMGGEAYATSSEMAKYLGPFERFESNKEQMLKVIRNHRRAIYGVKDEEYEGLTIKPMHINYDLVPDYLINEAKQAWDEALELGNLYGYRNAQTTLIAPTGTIGLLMDFDTTGIEPDFSLVKYKKLVGGGYFKIINQSVKPALSRLGYTNEQIQEIEKYIVGHQTLKSAPHINHDSLRIKGFTDTKILEIENLIKFNFDINSLFSIYNIKEDFITQTLGIKEEVYKNKNFNLLEFLGFTKEEIEQANEYIFGTMTIEGAPYIKEEHLPVFDCANTCGKKGKRFISPMGHIKQMAAAQPFLSGAISKTVNLPEESKLSDIEEIYLNGWKLMLKAVALYRDGSKLSQPLSSFNTENKYYKLLNSEDEIEVNDIQDAMTNYKPIRKKLPPERHSITHKFIIDGHEGYITVGLYEDGKPGEIFIKMSTAGSFLAGVMDAFAISLSISLQHGVELEDLIKNLLNLRFEPNGMTGNPEIPIAKSIIDYIARWLVIKFLPKEKAKIYHNEELVERSYSEKGSNFKLLSNLNINNNFSENSLLDQINNKLNYVISNNLNLGIDKNYLDKNNNLKNLGFTGEICRICGSMNIKKSGSCSVCIDCGNTTGCS